MKNILVIETSPRGSLSMSRSLTAVLLSKLQEKHPGSTITIQDLSQTPIPHLDDDHFGGWFLPTQNLTPLQRISLECSDHAITNLEKADIIVISAPIYNLSVPSGLKAWIDHIVRAGKTFRFNAQGGEEGLISGKKAYFITASGGIFSEGSDVELDFAVPYMKAILGFIGIKDLTILRVEGISIPGIKEKALEKAISQIVI